MASNGTAPDRMLDWVSPSSQRSTYDIIWSCLSIFIICSWRAFHLNLPTPQESVAGWHKFRLVGTWEMPYWPTKPLARKWRRKLVWMGTICLAPELGVSIAVKQNREARRALTLVNGNEYSEKLSLAHAFYAQMGGIVIRGIRRRPDAHDRSEADIKESDRVESWDIVSRLAGLRDPYLVSTINDADIGDKSHSDAITKIFAIIQCSWLMIHSIARAAQGLAISPLELATMAFIVCALIMYGFWWDKPFNVERRHVLLRIRWDNGDDDADQVYIYNHTCSLDGRVSETNPDRDDFGPLSLLFPERLTMGHLAKSWHVIPLYVTGLLFSAIHLAAWNWDFPSPLIQALWRWSAVTALVLSLCPLYVALVVSPLDWASKWVPWLDHVISVVTPLTFLIMFLAYTGARLIILSLSFYCLTSMPASTYERVAWTGFVPHFGS